MMVLNGAICTDWLQSAVSRPSSHLTPSRHQTCSTATILPFQHDILLYRLSVCPHRPLSLTADLCMLLL